MHICKHRQFEHDESENRLSFLSPLHQLYDAPMPPHAGQASVEINSTSSVSVAALVKYHDPPDFSAFNSITGRKAKAYIRTTIYLYAFLTPAFAK